MELGLSITEPVEIKIKDKQTLQSLILISKIPTEAEPKCVFNIITHYAKSFLSTQPSPPNVPFSRSWLQELSSLQTHI